MLPKEAADLNLTQEEYEAQIGEPLENHTEQDGRDDNGIYQVIWKLEPHLDDIILAAAQAKANFTAIVTALDMQVGAPPRTASCAHDALQHILEMQVALKNVTDLFAQLESYQGR